MITLLSRPLRNEFSNNCSSRGCDDSRAEKSSLLLISNGLCSFVLANCVVAPCENLKFFRCDFVRYKRVCVGVLLC